MAFAISDELLPVFVPVAVYWIGAAIYHLFLCPGERNKLFTKEEEESQNLATRRQVLVGVLVNQALQMLLAVLIFVGGGERMGGSAGGAARPASLLRIVGQLAAATLVMDGWGYFWHRWTHESKFLYKHVHAMHHRLIVPYTYGAQYIHLVDAIGGQIVGGFLATVASGMSPRTATVFFALLTLKGLDDHCGMWFPGHPVHRWLANNSAFHALHHQHAGVKYNYSVFFLATWDLLLGTYLPFSVHQRRGGGYQIAIAAKDKKEQ